VRVDVALLPAALAPAALSNATVLVVDVLRASTTIVTALTNGCLGIVPLDDPDEARRRAANQPGSLIAGERRGEPLEGFDLGSSVWTRRHLLEFVGLRRPGRALLPRSRVGRRPRSSVDLGTAERGVHDRDPVVDVPELETAEDEFVPRRLPALVPELVLQGTPATPIDAGV
jgi:hypothetical protein